MSAHTPGPWQIKSDHEPEYIVGDIDGPDDGTMYYQPVAMVMETKSFGANARLIAAAPELLRALKAMEVEKSDYMKRNNLGDPAQEHTCMMARAAIAKAEAA